MATYDIVYDYGMGIPVETVTGTQHGIIRFAKEHGRYNNAKRITIYHTKTTKTVGSWIKKGSRWYEDY